MASRQRVRYLTHEEMYQLLEELPDDDGDTEVESDDDTDEIVTNPSNCNFDSVFETELGKVSESVPSCSYSHVSSENVNNDDEVDSETDDNAPVSKSSSSSSNIPETSGLARGEKQKVKNNPVEPNRLWRKRETEKYLPPYAHPESVVEGYFEMCFTPTDFFIKIVDDVIEDIVYQSNLFATQKHTTLNLKKGELYAFIGINFFMGFHKLPSWKNYWSLEPVFSVQIVRDTMSRNRFDDILSNLHVNDNSTIPLENKDRTWKLKPMIEKLNTTFGTVYHGTREVSVDESMILFKGRSTMKQYNPMKPVKRGYKIWCLADQRGFIMKFSIYQGKNEELEQEFGGFGLGERVVLSLTKDVWNSQRVVVFDNYFTSLPLLEKLKNEGTLACGTIRAQRKGMPSLQDEKKLKRGEFDFRIANGVGVFKWKDTKGVLLASNYHGSETTSVKRRAKDGSKLDVACPEVVKDYNSYMGGVDHADRLRMAYGVSRRSKKWWQRLFWGMLDIAFVNSYIVHAAVMEEKMTLLEFRKSVAQGLMTNKVLPSTKKNLLGKRSSQSCSPTTAHKRRGRVESVCPDMRLGNRGVHWPKFVKERGRCEMCSLKGIQSRPHSQCSHCKCFLCCNDSKNCFAEYHGME